MIIYFVVLFLIHQPTICNYNLSLTITESNTNLSFSTVPVRHLSVPYSKKTFEALNPIKCYSRISGINKIERYSNLSDSPEVNVTCQYDSTCVKYTIISDISELAIWKGCLSNFQKEIGRIYGHYVVNSCFNAQNNDDETICFCNDKEYCNSQSKTFFSSIFYCLHIMYLFYLMV
uniref:Uncharacterized protein n=1 Tax=Strongyloides papillosus TaxID=174720 RepID=A0A0N5BLA0_STREA